MVTDPNPALAPSVNEWPKELKSQELAATPLWPEPERVSQLSSDKDQVQGPALNWLFVDLNSYFASVEQQVRPDLRGRPVAVVPMMAETTVCIAASYEAKAYGVRTGTVVADAKRMCPELVLVEGRHDNLYRLSPPHRRSRRELCAGDGRALGR
jgi:impB/mucB/samB family